MGLATELENIVGGNILQGVQGVATAVGDQVNKKAELQADLAKTEIQADSSVAIAQNQVNGVQAASSDKFTSRMRPVCGYGCMIVILYAEIIQPLIVLGAKLFGNPIVLPNPDVYAATTILMGLIGLRSYDKLKGTASSWVDPG